MANPGRIPAASAARLVGRIFLILVAGYPGSAPGADSISVSLQQDKVTLEARGASRLEILGELGQAADFKVIVVDRFHDPGEIDLKLTEMAVEQAVRGIVRGTSHILFYLPGSKRITQVWLLASDSPGPASVTTATGTGEAKGASRLRSQAVLRLAGQAERDAPDPEALGQVQTTLIDILATDRDALVRTRAAMALGKIGGDRAVTALEAASREEHPTVRAQAINALGQMDSSRSVDMLGNILLDVDRPRIERVMAARALWRQESPDARNYLAIGSYDADTQVRQASSRQPPPAADGPLSGQRGTFEAE